MRACTRAGTRGRVPSCRALSHHPGAPAELCQTLSEAILHFCGPAAGPGEALWGSWSGGDGLLAGTTT
eukprot:4228166-Pyramimonas_sp.AAC.1